MTLPVNPALYGTFLATMAVMAMTPGPANLFAIATGMRRGKQAVLLAVLGMNCATLVWFGGAALGLGALVTAFPEIFHLLAIGGALYLAWLGFSSIRSGWRNDPDAKAPETDIQGSAFRDGFAVQLANPKALLFFTAVLPPFLDPKLALPPQLAFSALATIGMDIITMTSYGLGGAALADRMTRPAFRKGFRFGVGGLLILAAILVVSRS